MTKNIGKLAVEELRIMEDVGDVINGINNQIAFEKNFPSARKEIRVRQIISEYVNLTRNYREKYGLNFADETGMLCSQLMRNGYDPEDFRL